MLRLGLDTVRKVRRTGTFCPMTQVIDRVTGSRGGDSQSTGLGTPEALKVALKVLRSRETK